MSDLRERLKRLRGEAAPPARDGDPVAVDAGVAARVGPRGADVAPAADALPAADAPPATPTIGLPGGVTLERAEGLAHLIDARVAAGAMGRVPLVHASPPGPLQQMAGGAAEREFAAHEVAYLDTETTGLAGGTGTLVFLVGIGRFGGEGFDVRQVFLLGPQHERAHLAALTEAVAGARAVVTYNGASFDLPQLRTRYLLHGLPDPFRELLHFDLLPVARRLWSDTLPDCRLGTVEQRLFGAHRSHADVPGWMVPERYAAYLRFGDAAGLDGVLEHNRVDVAALAALQAYVTHLFDGRREASGAEQLALARLCEATGAHEVALRRYARCEESTPEAKWRASLLHKRAGRLASAEARWRVLADRGHAEACVELAKLHEHRFGAFDQALAHVARAREVLPPHAHRAREELDRRERRLRRKRKRNGREEQA